MTDYAQLVEALRAVPGIDAADLEPAEDGDGVGQLRLGLTPGVDEVQVASTVGKLLREQFGLGVDTERVQLVEDAESPASRGGAGRPVISRMQLVSSGLEVTATVSLLHGDRTVSGQSAGTATQTGVHRAVAAATLRAIEQLVGSRARLELEHVDVTPTGPGRTALAAVTMVSSTGADRLTGSAHVREDVRQAVIRAVLDAVNRRLEPLLD